MRNRCLILSVSRKVSLIQAFRSAGWNVTGQDLDPNAIALSFCDVIALPNQENGPFDLILATRDADLKHGSHRCSDETIHICQDKVEFFRFCKENGFGTPEIKEIIYTDLRGEWKDGFLKPRVSSSENKSGGYVECVSQEIIKGEEYSVDIFVDFRGNVLSVVPRIRLKVVSGESVLTRTVLNQQLISHSILFTKSLSLIGHNVLQCFLNNSQIIWTDVNLRYGGASAVAIAAGCKSPQWYLKLINGEEVKPCIGDYKVGLMGRSYSEWEFD